jgi:hypothetical protein
MDKKINGHNAAYLKRQAKNLKKEQDIPYRKALDQAAIAAGFTGYKQFENLIGQPVKRKRIRLIPAPGAPTPLVITFNTFGARKPVERPNARMSLDTHIELGKVLKGVLDAADEYKRVKNAVRDVRSRLDDWVACEYPDHTELPNEVFYNIYYGNQGTPTEYSPSAERKQQLVELCQIAKSILGKNYHECRPLRELNQRLDAAIKWIHVWPEGRKPKGYSSRGQVAAGSLILIKSNRKPAILIRHETRNRIVHCYGDAGPMIAGRDEVIVPKDQSAAATFKPMRLWLPYVKFSYADGTELLVNRDYRPLWARKNGKVVSVDPDAIAHHNGEAEGLFKDGSTPWGGNKNTLSTCLALLKEWGVTDRICGPLALLPQAIATGNPNVLRPENKNKQFPENPKK